MSAIKPIVHTADIRMNAHDHSRSSFTVPCQDWQGFPCLMRVHENQCVKWAGVAGLRARIKGRKLGREVHLQRLRVVSLERYI
nr:MAG TPA: hypothetical protein [Caudoviricetes sp.]